MAALTNGQSFRLRALRLLRVDGATLLAGCEFLADAATAVELIEGGAAMLADDRDLRRLAAAARPTNGAH